MYNVAVSFSYLSARQNVRFLLMKVTHYCISAVLSVDGCTDYASGIACSLAAWIESAQTDMVECCLVARDAHWRRGTCLDGDDGGLVGKEAMMMLAKEEEGFT